MELKDVKQPKISNRVIHGKYFPCGAGNDRCFIN